MLTHTCTTDLKQINPLNGSTSERLAFTRMWYILCAITYMCTTDLKRINYPAQWEHTSVELCLLSFIFLYLFYCSGLFHQCSHICETGYCSLVPEKWDWKSGIQSGIKWMGLLNVFHLIWLSGQTTLSLSLSVRRCTPTCEAWYQFGTDDYITATRHMLSPLNINFAVYKNLY